ncbi:MAG: hypothetical protein P8Y03_25380 [Anaerolineales bacterium]|jgi:hypothetical protein
MKLDELLKRLLRRLKLNRAHTDGGPPSPQPQEVLKAMLHKIARTQEIELTCGEVFELLDQYAEMVANGEDVAEIMPLVKQHLEMCPDCDEEFKALLRVLQNSTAL